MLDDAFESVKMNMAATSVLLGLTPSILALMGPSVVELATLSTRSPWLAVLLVVTSLPVNSLKLFIGWQASLEVSFHITSFAAKAWHSWCSDQYKSIKMAMRGAQIIMALGMLVNIDHMNIYLDLGSTPFWV